MSVAGKRQLRADSKPRAPGAAMALALRLSGCFGAIFAATVVVGLEDSGNLIWVANGLLLSYLLLAPKWLWRHYFAAGFTAILLGGLAVNPTIGPNASCSAC